MPDQTPLTEFHNNGAAAVINHLVCDDKQIPYNAWLDHIGTIVKEYSGFLDSYVIRPVPELTNTYTIIIRFADRTSLQQWLDSEQRKQLIDEVRPLLATEDDVFIQSGLEFLFPPEAQSAKTPIRWKQLLMIWSAIYPLVLIVPLLLLPILRGLGLPEYRGLDMLLISFCMVTLMVYLIMPHYTRLLQRWLFR